MDKYGVAVLHKALDLLETLAEVEKGLPLQDLAARTGQPKTSVFRLLATLESRGYVERSPESAYRLGARTLFLSKARAKRADLRQIAQPFMTELRDRFGDTVNMGMLAGNQVTYLEVVEGTNPLRFVEPPGTMGPLHATALGKALLAWMEPSALNEVIYHITYQAFTSHTIVSPAALVDDLSLTRERGYALDDEESVLGARCVAVPIFGPEGHEEGAVSIAMPRGNADDKRTSEVVAALKEAGQQITARLKAKS